ncbi:hypothetical protein ACU635_15430 [[Actinomadura] parvosata]|uniref:hypothetical protein n=1 Tax=[Actinomadura] parvosata TaxID=1955412 RepID=UPI00406C7999
MSSFVRGVAAWTSPDDGQSWAYHYLPAYGDQMTIGSAAISGNTILILARIGYGPDFSTAALIRNGATAE